MTRPVPREQYATILTVDGDPLFAFDCVLSEEVNDQAEVPEHDVEDGYKTSDHHRPELESIDVEGIVTNSPLWIRDAAADRDFSLYAELRKLYLDGGPYQIVTGQHTIDRGVIASIRAPRSYNDGQSLRIPVKFQRIRIVSPQTIILREQVDPSYANDATEETEEGRSGGSGVGTQLIDDTIEFALTGGVPYVAESDAHRAGGFDEAVDDYATQGAISPDLNRFATGGDG